MASSEQTSTKDSDQTSIQPVAKESSIRAITCCAEPRKSGEEESGLALCALLTAVGNCLESRGVEAKSVQKEQWRKGVRLFIGVQELELHLGDVDYRTETLNLD